MVIAIIITVIAICLIAFLVWASSTISSGVFLKAFCKLKDSSDKVVYLTFDDGPDAEMTPKVLEVLAKHKAKATFFMVGMKTSGNESTVLQVIAEGHQIGNHTSSHANAFPLYNFSRMNIDISSCSMILEAISGSKIRMFRPPFGVVNPTIAKCVRDLDMSVVGWNIRTFDTKHPDPDTVLEIVKKKLVPGSVILLHDRLKESPVILETLLNYLEQQNYIFDRPLPV